MRKIAELQKATFAAGCFWQIEVDFRNTDGVKDVRVGYTGGHLDEPSYEQVCRKDTGHAEAVEATFDPTEVNYKKLLDVFWKLHDPTTLNRQGPNVGSQYRSAIFYHTAEQQKEALTSKAAHQTNLGTEIITEITRATTFWPAEDYHQRYLEKRGLATCKI